MDQGIVIGEGVVLETRPASFASRAVGALLDVVVTLVLAFGALYLVTGTAVAGSELVLDPQWGQTLTVVLVVTLLVVWPVTFETLSRGRSPGKLAMGLRVVRDDGGPVRFRHAFVRALVGVFELWLTFGSVAVVASLSNARGKRLGDVLAGTYAVRVRSSRGWTTPLVLAPGLGAWVEGADIRRLPDGLALEVRQVLDRAPRLSPESRRQLTDALAGQVEPYVAPGPPPGTPAELFLHAVLHERRRRELERGEVERDRAAAQAAVLHRLPYGVPDPRG
ncbi:putative RDD family membrane protein YckC [Isoptericola jiangsuensis]|uniref:Putative RDD family membrane protein YckC n=1 Tax=Isoptericola jiangsuensis TaxID=548579 RepID=A0A2A9F0T6_9MICO|nr:RDD family protein [Isoptericola jiangsuensis]PFG44039.1 putative RDD family membrane protein YckC [Isoptericola jiangsuensis]